MNNTRRNELARIQCQITAGLTAFKEARAIIEDVKAEEEEAYGDATPGKQDGDWGQESQACTDAMQTLIDAIDSVDLSEPMDELGRAVDRALSAPEGKLTKAEAEIRRYRRLPKWAHEAIDRAVQAKENAESKASSMFKDFVEGSKHPVMFDWSGELNGKEIPTERIKFPQVGLTLYIEQGYLCVHADEGAVQILPRTSNEAYVRARDWRDV